MAEATPLLVDNNHEEFDSQKPASAHFKRAIKILTIISLVISALSIVILIANHIIVGHVAFNYTWGTRQAISALGTVLFVSLIFGFVNLWVHFPILPNIIVDIVLLAVIITRLVIFFENLPTSGWCTSYRYPYPPVNDPKCKPWKLALTIMMGIAGGLGVIVGAIHLILLLLRGIAILRTKFWKRSFPWSLPVGQFSLELSIKVGRTENPTTGIVRNAADTESGSGVRGPIHL